MCKPLIDDRPPGQYLPVFWFTLFSIISGLEYTIAAIKQETLIIHGLEDKVIPVSCSERLLRLIPNSQLHIFRKCGHWTPHQVRGRLDQHPDSCSYSRIHGNDGHKNVIPV